MHKTHVFLSLVSLNMYSTLCKPFTCFCNHVLSMRVEMLLSFFLHPVHPSQLMFKCVFHSKFNAWCSVKGVRFLFISIL